MNRIISLFLFIFIASCLNAQYNSPIKNKVTLGKQTTADGLVFRGVASIDTLTASKITRANKQDTSVFLLLDTVTNLLWHYKTSSNRWIQAGGSTLDTATMLLPYYRAGRNTIKALDVPTLNQTTTGSAATLTTGRTIQTNLASTSAATFNGSANITTGVTGVLPVANGGTGRSDNIALIVQDQSGNYYNTVAIGTQVWFRENLKTKKYRSGALIPVKTNTDTSTLVGQMYYYLNDSLTNYLIYGALYNWKATQNSDSLCPVGWHVPTDTEWTILTNYLASTSVAGGKMKSTGTTYWDSPNTDATNESGFSALPGGVRNIDGTFSYINSLAFFWSATEPDFGSAVAWYRNLYNGNGIVDRFSYFKSIGNSVRCLKN